MPVDDDDGAGGRPLQPGVWYYRIVEADHMAFVINRRRGGVQFDLVYDSIFRNCRRLCLPDRLAGSLQKQS